MNDNWGAKTYAARMADEPAHIVLKIGATDPLANGVAAQHRHSGMVGLSNTAYRHSALLVFALATPAMAAQHAAPAALVAAEEACNRHIIGFGGPGGESTPIYAPTWRAECTVIDRKFKGRLSQNAQDAQDRAAIERALKEAK